MTLASLGRQGQQGHRVLLPHGGSLCYPHDHWGSLKPLHSQCSLALALPKASWCPRCLLTSPRPLPALTCSHLLLQGLERQQLKPWLGIRTWWPALQSWQNSDHHRRDNKSVWQPCIGLSRKTCSLCECQVGGDEGYRVLNIGRNQWEHLQTLPLPEPAEQNFSLKHWNHLLPCCRFVVSRAEKKFNYWSMHKGEFVPPSRAHWDAPPGLVLAELPWAGSAGLWGTFMPGGRGQADPRPPSPSSGNMTCRELEHQQAPGLGLP